MALISFHRLANFHIESIAAPALPTTTFTVTQTVLGTSTTKEKRTIQCVAELAGNLNFKGISISSAINERNFYFYFKVDGVDRDPAFAEREGHGIEIASGATADTIAAAINAYINANLSNYFTSTVLTDTVTIENKNNGECLAATDGSDTTYDLSGSGITTLKAVTGWVWYTAGGGNVGSILKRRKYYRFIINIEDYDISWSY